MKERPILMNAAMVRATLSDAKTQTRRLAKLSGHDGVQADHGAWRYCEQHHDGFVWQHVADIKRVIVESCPYGVPGDRLYVRETWCSGDRYAGMENDPPQIIRYRADKGARWFRSSDPGDHFTPDMTNWGYPKKWRPSIHMPRWASRITLEVTEVCVQRLHDISEEDAKAEGIEQHSNGYWLSEVGLCWPTAREAFAALWDAIYGPGSWDANPYVWAVSFRRLP